MNQGKLEVVKQEMARVNVNILGISELKCTGKGEFNSDDHYIYYCRQESFKRNGVAIMVNKGVRNAVLGCNLKDDRMISVRFQGKLFNITVMQVYALPTSNAEETEVERFYEDLQDLLELTSKKHVLFIIGDWNANAKECSNYHTIALISHASKVMFKILQARLQQYMNHELLDGPASFRKGRVIRD